MPALKSATRAVKEAMDRGEEVATTKDEAGNEYIQRPVSLDLKRGPGRPRKNPGARVKVYNKLKTRLYLSDGVLEANAEAEILVTDLAIPGIKRNVLKIA
jgi:hypothetical protein